MESIVVIIMTAMLLSCSNDMKDVEKYSSDFKSSGIYAKQLEMLYSDSLIVRYKIKAKEYLEYTEGDVVVREFNKGLFAESFDKNSKFEASIKSQYAKYNTTTGIWTVKYGVEVLSSDGYKLNTELLYWDQQKGIIYSDKYVRINKAGEIIEGASGFQSNQDLTDIEFKQVSGDIEI